ncbi:MAG: HAD family hydrolase [Verrucomicrobia bacterium]|nr:HAD family hydrolase [Verrucomicrobiota bacterium]
MPTLRAILFDLDDTLLVDEAVSYEVLEAVAEQAKKKFGIDPRLFVSDLASIAKELWVRGECYSFCHAIGISAFECLWGNFLGDAQELMKLRRWSQQYREEVFQKTLQAQKKIFPEARAAAQGFAQEFSKLRRQRQRLFPEAREVLEKLASRFKLGLITNGAPDLQREKIAATKCEHFFSAMVISGELGIGKPNPLIFEEGLHQLNMKREEAIMVGNSLERDIAGARATGIHSVWIRLPGEKNVETVVPDKTIADLRELLDIFSSSLSFL